MIHEIAESGREFRVTGTRRCANYNARGAKVIAVSGDSTYVVSQTVEDDILEHAQAPGADRVLRTPLDPVEPLKDCIPKPFELSYVGDVVAAAVTVRPWQAGNRLDA